VTEAAVAMKHITPQHERVPLRTKMAFGIGTTAESIVAAVIGLSALFYYNQVLGMSGTLAGLAITISLILDAISDPLVGSLSDRTRSKYGRRHIYMLFAPAFICLSLYLIFNPPKGLSEIQLFFWFTTFLVLMRQAMTFFHVPHLAMGGELSRDYMERSRIMAFSSFFGFLGGAPFRFMALSVFFAATAAFPNGLYNPAAYGPMSAWAACIAFVALMASTLFTMDQIPRLAQPAADQKKFSPFEFFGDMSKAFRNMNYTWLLIGYFFLSLMLGLRGGLDVYINTHFWLLPPEKLRWFIIGSFAGYLFAFFVAPRLHGKFDKRATIITCCLLYSISPAMPVLLYWAGLFPAPGTDAALAGLIISAFFSYGLIQMLSISVMSALADIADENELKYGVRQEGVLYATRTFFAKVDQAVGVAAAGIVLDLIHFPKKAKFGEVNEEVLFNLALWESPIATIPGLIAVFFYARFRVSRNSYAKTRADLEARRKSSEPLPANARPTAGPGDGDAVPESAN
jgi:Na+/melibiose symporter-like transporter